MPGIHIVYCLAYTLTNAWHTHCLLPGIQIVYCLVYTLANAWHTHCLLPGLQVVYCFLHTLTNAWHTHCLLPGIHIVYCLTYTSCYALLKMPCDRLQEHGQTLCLQRDAMKVKGLTWMSSCMWAASMCCMCLQQGKLQREACYGCWHARVTQDKKTG